MTDVAVESTHGDSFLAGGGELGALIRAHDWRSTPLGDPDSWPQSLRTTVRLMLNTNHPVFIFWGQEMTCLYNDAYRMTMGPERHPSALGAPGRLVWNEIWDIIGPDLDGVREGRGATWNVDRLVPVTRHGVREDVYWTYSYSPIDDDALEGGIGGVLVICNDVTEQHNAAEALASERSRLLELFRQAPGFIAVLIGPDHVIDLVNDSYLRLVGGRDVLGKSVRDAFPELEGQGYYELLDAVYATGTPYFGEGAPVLMDFPGVGEQLRYVTFVYQPIRDYDGRVTGILVEGQDVTDSKGAELQLREALDANAAIFDYSQDFICTMDATGTFVSANRRCEALFGYRVDQMIGRPSIVFVHPDDVDRTRDAFAAMVNGQPATAFENRFVHSSGAFVPLLWSGVWVADQGRVVAVARDLSERIRAEELLRQAQRAEAVARLTGGVAHDFNNLLTVIMGNAELLSEELHSDARLGPMAGMILEAAERGGELTHRLLAFAQQQNLEPRVVDLRELVAGMETLLRRTLGEDVEIGISHENGLWRALIDPTQMENVLLGLCTNARDAMPTGGHLVIELANIRLDQAYVSAYAGVAPGQYVMVSVSDSGSGIPAEDLERVFEPFYTTRSVGKGTGLGLSMVQGFIRQSHGHITIYSEPGEGTTVRIYLPRTRENLDADVEDATAIGGGTETILVVDDDALVRRFAAGQLTDLGYTVIEAENGPDALAILEERDDIDLLFTDVVMPGGMTGAQLAAQATIVRPNLGILYTSGYTKDAIVQRGRLESGVHLLSKPYSLTALARHIRSALPRLTT